MTGVIAAAYMVATVLAQTQAAPAAAMHQTIALQVALDRAGFSPGAIDGHMGLNTERALDAYRQQNGRDPDPYAEPILTIQITDDDAAGPFVENIPSDLIEQSKLPALGYRSVVELLSERFHADPRLVRALNPEAAFTAGESVSVPNVDPMILPIGTRPAAPAGAPVVVRVSRSASALTVTGPDGRIQFFAPVTTGSDNDP